MHTIKHTLILSGSYYFNLRVPREAQHLYGSLIRFKLGSTCPSERGYLTLDEVRVIVGKLTCLLYGSFDTGHKIDYKIITATLKPKKLRLTDFMEEYVSVKGIHCKPSRIAVNALVNLSGDREVGEYSREDARAFLAYLRGQGVSTATIRRRIGSISAILNYAYAELDLDRRNPFAKVIIPGEGKDAVRRGVFTLEQLATGYEQALQSKKAVRLLMPILGETGCRLAEIVGLRVEDVDLEERLVHVRPHPHRRLKTTGSQRSLPLVGSALEAVSEALRVSDGQWLFPRYYRPEGFATTHASNALNKWLKHEFDGLTAHSLRHTMRDRLRAVEAPMELIDQVGGWSSVNTMGSRYGQGYKVEQLRVWLERIAIIR